MGVSASKDGLGSQRGCPQGPARPRGTQLQRDCGVGIRTFIWEQGPAPVQTRPTQVAMNNGGRGAAPGAGCSSQPAPGARCAPRHGPACWHVTRPRRGRPTRKAFPHCNRTPGEGEGPGAPSQVEAHRGSLAGREGTARPGASLLPCHPPSPTSV